MIGLELTSERLVLRPYEMGDIAAWQRWDVEEEVQHFLPEPRNVPVSDGEQRAYLESCAAEEDGVYWTIVWRESGMPIGTISLTDMDHHHGLAELGIVIGEKVYWGRGVAQEAIGLVVAAARERLGLRRLTAECERENVAMIKVLESTGFIFESVCVAARMKVGKPIDTVRYYMLLTAT